MSKVNVTVKLSAEAVKAMAFDIIAKYVHENYDTIGISNVTSDEAFFVTTVTTTEHILEKSVVGEEES